MPRDVIREELEGRARKALLSYALFRWESAVIIALTILLSFFYPHPFPWWRWYYWAILGLVAEALIIYTSLTDERTGERVVAELFRERHNPRLIRSLEYRGLLERALNYQAQINQAIREIDAGPLRDRLERANRGVTDWISQIFQLAQRLDRFEHDQVLAEDMKSVPAALKNLEARYKLEDDEGVRIELLRSIQQKRTQWENLQQLQNTMEGAKARLEATLTALGTIYSQMLLARAKSFEGTSAEAMNAGIQEQIDSLHDVIETMDEVLKY